MYQRDRFTEQCLTYVATLNNPTLTHYDVIQNVRAHCAAVLWCQVAGLCPTDALFIFSTILYDNLWIEPASLAERRVTGCLDELFGTRTITNTHTTPHLHTA